MNSLFEVVDYFSKLKNKGWIKTGTEKHEDFFFPNLADIKVKCVGDSFKYPIWLMTIKHGLTKEYFDNSFNYLIETDRNYDALRLLIYKNNNLILKKELMKLSDFEYFLNKCLSRLALIYMDSKIYRKANYYKYSKLQILRFKGTNTFIQLLNQKIIRIKVTSKSVLFVISKKEINKIYKIEYNYDDNMNSFLNFLDK